MNAGKRLILGFRDIEICTINNTDYVRMKDVPDIVKYLYGQRLVEFAKSAVDGVVLHYDQDRNTIEIVDPEFSVFEEGAEQ